MEALLILTLSLLGLFILVIREQFLQTRAIKKRAAGIGRRLEYLASIKHECNGCGEYSANGSLCYQCFIKL